MAPPGRLAGRRALGTSPGWRRCLYHALRLHTGRAHAFGSFLVHRVLCGSTGWARRGPRLRVARVRALTHPVPRPGEPADPATGMPLSGPRLLPAGGIPPHRRAPDQSAAAAAITSRLKLGTCVCLISQHHRSISPRRGDTRPLERRTFRHRRRLARGRDGASRHPPRAALATATRAAGGHAHAVARGARGVCRRVRRICPIVAVPQAVPSGRSTRRAGYARHALRAQPGGALRRWLAAAHVRSRADPAQCRRCA